MPTPTKKKRKIFRKLLFLLFGSILIFILAMENLNTYSIYYEEQLATSEKERRDNIIKVTVTNLKSLNYKDIPNMRFDFDGYHFIENQQSSFTKDYPSISYSLLIHIDAIGYRYRDKQGYTYEFNNNLQLVGAFSNNHKSLEFKQFDEEQIKDEMYDTLRPVIEAQKKPVIFNLQWLYKLWRK
ncbi:hypothetical protein BVE84_06235 [Streptococcus azizii]|uniref:DUF4825 domain-containing protein n=1 Tax=Streptococcus azizii TaxID=1579424 RepID=A0AB36JQX7_9STRE|nr:MULTISPECIES: hypothetical protein [Streptococcus]MBF0776188.1 hypothetical protein [Streptococcus sp. 19428wD3_AN2]ONK26960.1 hypothetical protein BVE86_06430 [Streptococcus azizii]ONK27982.1 hypothetical protein BVE85_05785 [Streptococcus azizii]ONK28826.1 hypothetical protein BVE84_06235 [Streptococcus azizii]TFU83531.1 hypothetical protein E4T83_05290 [Streptococcus sp. AN2]